MNNSEIFDSLLKNAIDFLKNSVSEVKKKPKYSVIRFCSSIELLFKSRLLIEDWALVFPDPKKANREDLINGSFYSIGMGKLINRIECITEENFSKHEKEVFKKVRDRRNKIVHFFNSEYVEKPADNVIYDIVAEQCQA
jgi:Apea-like HEPN